MNKIDFAAEYPKKDMSKVNRIRVNGKVYLAADKVLEIIDELNDTKALVAKTQLGNFLHKTLANEIKAAVEALKGDET